MSKNYEDDFRYRKNSESFSKTEADARFLQDAPQDGQDYARRDGSWVVVTSAGQVIKTISAAVYTVLAEDSRAWLRFTSACAVTVPDALSITAPIDFFRFGTGDVVISSEGVRQFNGETRFTLASQYSHVSATPISAAIMDCVATGTVNFDSTTLWTPAQITSGLVGWCDSVDAGSFNIDGINEVLSWGDTRGTSFALTGVNSPVRLSGGAAADGLASVRLSGASQQLLTISPALTTVRTVVVVMGGLSNSTVSGSGAQPTFVPILSENATSNYDFVFTTTNQSVVSYSVSLDGSAINSGRASSNGSTPVSGTNIDLGLNAAQSTEVRLWFFEFNNPAEFDWIGRLAGPGQTYFMNGDICEILFFDRVITDSERQNVEGYALWRRGLEAGLPSGHPYENAPPTV